MTQAMSRTKATAAARIRRACPRSPTTCSRRGTMPNWSPPFARIELGMVATQARGQRVHLGLRLLPGHSGLQLADDVVVLAVAGAGRLRVQGEGQDHLGVLRPAQGRHDLAREIEPLGQHPHDLVRLPAQHERAADGRGIAAVAPHPGGVAEDRSPGVAGHVVGRAEEPADRGPRPQHLEQVRRDAEGPDPLRLRRPRSGCSSPRWRSPPARIPDVPPGCRRTARSRTSPR